MQSRLLFRSWCNGSCHTPAPSLFEEMAHYRRHKHRRRRSGNANGSSKFRKYRVYLPLLRQHDRNCSSAADGSGSCYAPAPSYFEEMTHCRHQKLHWRWPSNHNGWSKFRNLGLFTFTRSQMTRRRRLRGWWRLPEITRTARHRRQKHRRDDQDRSKFRKYKNLFIRDQAKLHKKLLFAATTPPPLTALRTVFFPTITRNGFRSHLQKIISRWPWPPTEKPRYTYCIVFFVDSIYSKTIDIIRKNIDFLILNRGPMCKSEHPDNGAIL